MPPLSRNRYIDALFPATVAFVGQKTLGTHNRKFEQHRLLKSTCFNTLLRYRSQTFKAKHLPVHGGDKAAAKSREEDV
jgi:hypothetical protein